MEAVKKYWIWGIFISILSIFAMSHNAGAIELSLDLDNYNLSRNLGRIYLDMYVNDSLSCNGVASCTVYNTTDFAQVKKFTTHSDYSYKAGDLVILRAFVGSQSSSGNYTNIVPFIQQNFTTNNNNFVFLGYNEHQVNSVSILSQLGYGPNANEFYTQITSIYNQLSVIEYYFRVQVDGNYQIGFESTNYTGVSTNIFNLASYSPNSAIYFRILGLTAYSPTETKENKEVEQKTQEAVDESQTAGGDSSTSAQTGTTGLLNAITGAVNVIAAARPTNCKINGNMGNLDIGQLDLCANPAPAFVQTIGSLILILMCVPLAISLFNRFIAIFRSFQS